MSIPLPTRSVFRNEMLTLLPATESDRLAPLLSLEPFKIGAVLIAPDRPIEYVYFPESLIASVIALPKGERIEAVSVGREGFVGVPALLGGETLSETIVQIAGDAYRITANHLLALLPQMPMLAALLDRYMLTMIDEISLTAACNRAHPLSERCAKWLLLVRDRQDENEFLLTHKFLATMLGVRRAGVTVAAGMLQKAGIIKYSRGRVTILNHLALEDATCECYGMIRGLQQRKAEVAATNPDSMFRRPVLLP